MQTLILSLRQLFEHARELRGPERAAYLAEHCPDTKRRDQVERLLTADAEEGDGALAQDPGQVARALGSASMPLPAAGHRVGAWQLLALIGEGGSSTVFHAKREGDGVVQEAALKLLRRGIYTAAAQKQFRRERRALAQLRHSGIARLIEGGVTETGMAYIALELVEGLPITEHALTRQLSLRERLVLFLEVCRAVEAAHRALIVHRDLKPSNVLVTDDGHVKLLDFGIAKLLDDEDETRTQLPAFTPAYAAPEQLNGGVVSTATDVYALGILLGELVTGQRRGDGSGRTPSSRVTADTHPASLPEAPNALRRALRGDLDNIALKAMEEDSERRYASATALADDIERFLDGQPIAAHPPSRWYRTQKFVQRHRGGVAMTAVFLLAVLAALGVALWQGKIAREQATRANTVRDFLVHLFDAARAHLPYDQRPTPEALVEQARQQLSATRELDDATRADLLRTLGEVDLSLDRFANAQSDFSEALALTAALGDRDFEIELHVLRADALQRAGRAADALRELAPLPQWQLAAPPRIVMRALAVHAAAEVAGGEPDAAIADRRAALALAESTYGKDSVEALTAGFEIGNTLTASQRFPQAIATLAPLLERWHANQTVEDDRYVAALDDLATATDGLGDLAAAEARVREVLALKRKIFSAPHHAIATSLRNLGGVLVRAEKYAEAEQILEQSLEMDRQVFGDSHVSLVQDYDALGNMWVNQRKLEKAEAAYRSAIAVCESTRLHEESCPQARNDLGMTFYRQGRFDEAKTAMQQALAERRSVFGDDHPSVAYSLSTLANVAAKQKDIDEAVSLSRQALEVLEHAGMARSRESALTRNGYAQGLWLAKRYDEALREIDQSIADWRRTAPDGKSRHVMMLVQKAQIQRDLGNPAAARASADEAIALGVKADELAPFTRGLLRDLSGRSDVYPEPASAAH
jgi:tetratricopeptide (TPR) repeat protein